MSSTAKKTTKSSTSSTAGSAAPSSANSNKAKEAAFDAVKTTQDAADKVVTLSTEAMQQFWKQGSFEADKTREKVMALGRESAESWTRTADTAAQGIAEVVGIARENAEAAVECGNIATEATREFATDMYNFTNKLFADNVEASKQLFACRTANDFFDYNNELFRSNIEAFFSQSSKLSEKFFRYSQDISEPVQERVSEATDKLNKAFTS